MSDPLDQIAAICHEQPHDALSKIAAVLGFDDDLLPIDMVLHCPACGMQHIDAPEAEVRGGDLCIDWANEPHRSHLCAGCGHIWRPADVATTGVAAVKTKGTADSPIVTPEETIARNRGEAVLMVLDTRKVVRPDCLGCERAVCDECDPSEKHTQTSDTPIHWISIVDAMPAHGQKIAAASENGRWEETFNEDYVDLSMTHWRPL